MLVRVSLRSQMHNRQPHARCAVVDERQGVSQCLLTCSMRWKTMTFERVLEGGSRLRPRSSRWTTRRGCCCLPSSSVANKDCRLSSRGASKKAQRVGHSISLNRGPSKKWLPETPGADFTLTQETHFPQDSVVTEESWMPLAGMGACILHVFMESGNRERRLRAANAALA